MEATRTSFLFTISWMAMLENWRPYPEFLMLPNGKSGEGSEADRVHSIGRLPSCVGCWESSANSRASIARPRASHGYNSWLCVRGVKPPRYPILREACVTTIVFQKLSPSANRHTYIPCSSTESIRSNRKTAPNIRELGLRLRVGYFHVPQISRYSHSNPRI